MGTHPGGRTTPGPRWRIGPLADRLTAAAMGPVIEGRRIVLRPLRPVDFPAWREVRRRCSAWLTLWEPRRPTGYLDAAESRRTFEQRCEARDRERAGGAGYGFGIFFDGRFIGECNLNTIQRGAAQSAYIGYWIDEAVAGQGLMPEAVAVVMRFAFEDLGLHRIQISIVPRNTASRRVVEKLGLRTEGLAERYIEINGVWEDHLRFAMTAEEWTEHVSAYAADWF